MSSIRASADDDPQSDHPRRERASVGGAPFALLADTLRSAGWELVRSSPREDRSGDILTAVALRLGDAASTFAVERLAMIVWRWAKDHVLPRGREQGVSAVTINLRTRGREPARGARLGGRRLGARRVESAGFGQRFVPAAQTLA